MTEPDLPVGWLPECDISAQILELKEGPEERGAAISSCGRYRYLLWRRWAAGAPLLFVMLNPSTADGLRDDPTIRKCRGFAKRLGYPAFEVVNIAAWRATKPADLIKRSETHGDIVGPGNHEVIRAAATRAKMVIVAWGDRVWAISYEFGLADNALAAVDTFAFGFTNRSAPRHPLMLPYETKLRMWRPKVRQAEAAP